VRRGLTHVTLIEFGFVELSFSAERRISFQRQFAAVWISGSAQNDTLLDLGKRCFLFFYLVETAQKADEATVCNNSGLV
jgi:hypothetical protein